MVSGKFLIDLKSSRSWAWLNKNSSSTATYLPSLLSSLSTAFSKTFLGISVFGFEFSLLNPGISNPDCSFLLEPIEGGSSSNDGSTPLDRLFERLFQQSLVLSVWLEFDFPYKDQPLVYFTLADDLNNKPSSSLRKLVDLIFAPSNPFFKHMPSKLSFDTDQILDWLASCPDGQIQQLGFSLRDNKVQPRVLLKSDPEILSSYLAETNAWEVLESVCEFQQCLLAFAYPYSWEQTFACEVVADRCAQSNLRNLRHPPRIRGSRFFNVLKQLIMRDKSIVIDPAEIQSVLNSLEHRSTVPTTSLGVGQCIDLSGWNHLKLTFVQLKLENLKIYGGTVRNHFQQ